jgi:hypothetical protein
MCSAIVFLADSSHRRATLRPFRLFEVGKESQSGLQRYAEGSLPWEVLKSVRFDRGIQAITHAVLQNLGTNV